MFAIATFGLQVFGQLFSGKQCFLILHTDTASASAASLPRYHPCSILPQTVSSLYPLEQNSKQLKYSPFSIKPSHTSNNTQKEQPEVQKQQNSLQYFYSLSRPQEAVKGSQNESSCFCWPLSFLLAQQFPSVARQLAACLQLSLHLVIPSCQWP